MSWKKSFTGKSWLLPRSLALWLLAKWRQGQRITIRAAVHTLGGYSAHADQKDLLNFVGRMRHKPRQIRLVHGDAGAKEALRKLLSGLYLGMEVVVG